MSKQSIHELVSRVRSIVTEPRIQYMLMQSRGKWAQIACCMYTIEDAQLAIDTFSELEDQSAPGLLYLSVYGLLQALFIQQDAVQNLSLSLDLPFKREDYPGLKAVREVRNEIVGHPTSHSRGGQETYHTINRSSLSLRGFQVMDSTQSGDYNLRYIDLAQVISENETLLRQVLQGVCIKLEQEVRDHKRQFRDKPLGALFSSTLGYSMEKLTEGISASDAIDRDFAIAGLETITRLLDRYAEALKERGMAPETYPGIDMIWKELVYPIAALKRYLGLPSDERIQLPQPEGAYIFTWFLREKISELQELAEKIDKDYRDEGAA